MPVLDVEGLIDNRIEAIKDFHRQTRIPKAELDLSGGIDSAVMACLLKLALPGEDIVLVHSRCETDRAQTRPLLRGARRTEMATRHKFNPNTPTLGTRKDLLLAGILTNDLPLEI